MVTRGRDLRTGAPLWLSTAGISVRSRKVCAAGTCDVVIVGAGISGAMLAFALREKGASVLVVDRRPPLRGSTAASTALLQFEIDTPLHKLAEQIGCEKAERAWRRSAKSVANLRALVAAENIRCSWRDAATLYLAGDEFGSRAMRTESKARAAAGLDGTFLTQAELRDRFGIDRTGAIRSEGSARANPMQLAAGLFRRALDAGIRIWSPATIVGMAAEANGVTLTTDVGEEIAAGAAVFCTGYEILRQVPQDGHTIKSTWALATHPIANAPDWLENHLIWEGSDPYLYLRLTRGRRIVAGGEDEPFGKDHQDRKLLRIKTDVVAEKVKALLPGLRFRIAYRWAGAFGESRTGLPFIDAVPGQPNCFAVMGFGGNGITYSKIAAEIVPTLIEGKPDPDADLYRFSER